MKKLIFVQKYVQSHKFEVKNYRTRKYADTLVDSPMYVTTAPGQPGDAAWSAEALDAA